MTIKINDKDYSIKQTWKEFTYSELCEVVKSCELPLLEKVSKFSGIPFSVINTLTLPQMSFICDSVAFMEEYENCLLFVKDYKDDLSIAKETYGKLELAKTHLRGKPLLALGKIVEIYYGEDISDRPCLECLGKGLSLLEKIDSFVKSFPELYEYEPTKEELEAGVEDLTKLGSFYTVKKMSEKFQKHPDEILEWQAGVVYKFLQADAIDSRINRNLQKIYSRKK